MIADGTLLGPGLLLLGPVTLIMAALVLMRGRRFILPAYITTLSLTAGCGLAAWGTHDLVNRQFSLVLVVLAGLVALFIVAVASMIAARRDK